MQRIQELESSRHDWKVFGNEFSKRIFLAYGEHFACRRVGRRMAILFKERLNDWRVLSAKEAHKKFS